MPLPHPNDDPFISVPTRIDYLVQRSLQQRDQVDVCQVSEAPVLKVVESVAVALVQAHP